MPSKWRTSLACQIFGADGEGSVEFAGDLSLVQQKCRGGDQFIGIARPSVKERRLVRIR